VTCSSYEQIISIEKMRLKSILNRKGARHRGIDTNAFGITIGGISDNGTNTYSAAHAVAPAELSSYSAVARPAG
jgi:hypothetical protein